MPNDPDTYTGPFDDLAAHEQDDNRQFACEYDPAPTPIADWLITHLFDGLLLLMVAVILLGLVQLQTCAGRRVVRPTTNITSPEG